jgi:hypothetical protein
MVLDWWARVSGAEPMAAAMGIFVLGGSVLRWCRESFPENRRSRLNTITTPSVMLVNIQPNR